MEQNLNILLKNYLNNVDGILAVAIVDRNGLIIASENREDPDEDSDAVMGAISSMIDSYIDRIKNPYISLSLEAVLKISLDIILINFNESSKLTIFFYLL